VAFRQLKHLNRPVAARYTLKQAIEDKVLTPYNYHPRLVELTLPGSYNPLLGRLAVVAYFLASLVATLVSPRAVPYA